MLRKSGFGEFGKAKDSMPFEAEDRGQSCPQHWPRSADRRDFSSDDPLGEPLSLREVAQIIGCSAWTVRQRHLSAGLPHFRSGPNGKLIFYHNQVIHWLLKQQKGGTTA